MSGLVKNAGNSERKWRYRCVEIDAIVGLHLVTTLHCTNRCFKNGAARITKGLSRVQLRLFTDHSVTRNFLNLTVGVGYQPVPAEQLRGNIAQILDCDGVGKNVAIDIRFLLVVDILGGHLDPEFVFFFAHISA